MLRFGPDTGPTVIAALPLFEEANRTRAAVVDVLRRLAARGFGGALPDLPGTGESLVETRDATLGDWREAFAAAAATLPGPLHVMSWRGGSLVDVSVAVAGRWYLAPVSGATVVRELERVRSRGKTEGYAGNLLSDQMIRELASSEPATTGALRVVRLGSDGRPADAVLSGKPLWRSAEPATDATLQDAIADDVARWVGACAA